MLNSGGQPIVTPEGRVVVPLRLVEIPDGDVPAEVDGRLEVLLYEPGSRERSTMVYPLRKRSNVDERRASMGLSVGGMAQHVDRDGRGRAIHVVETTLQDGRFRLVLATSLDDGESWSDPVLVASPTRSGDQTNPAIAAGRDGTVGVVWNDFGFDPENACYAMMLAASSDQGRTFGRPMRLGEGLTCPAAPLDPSAEGRAGWLAGGRIDRNSPAFRWVQGGDTQGIVGLPDGSFAVVWPNGEAGLPRLWFTRLEPRGPG